MDAYDDGPRRRATCSWCGGSCAEGQCAAAAEAERDAYERAERAWYEQQMREMYDAEIGDLARAETHSGAAAGLVSVPELCAAGLTDGR